MCTQPCHFVFDQWPLSGPTPNCQHVRPKIFIFSLIGTRPFLTRAPAIANARFLGHANLCTISYVIGETRFLLLIGSVNRKYSFVLFSMAGFYMFSSTSRTTFGYIKLRELQECCLWEGNSFPPQFYKQARKSDSSSSPFRPPRNWTMSSNEKVMEIVVDEKESQYNIDDNSLDDDSKPTCKKGEPVITTGFDVSRFVVDIRDDEDPALTFRSMFLGTMFAGMGAALSEVNFWQWQQQLECCNVQTVILTISGRYTCSSQCRCQSPASSYCSWSTPLAMVGLYSFLNVLG